MHERRSDGSRASAEDEQLNIYKAEGQIEFVSVPKCPPTASELQRDDAGKTIKQMFCFIPVIFEGHQACQVKDFQNEDTGAVQTKSCYWYAAVRVWGWEPCRMLTT